MPAYNYTCTGCQKREIRIAGIDDHAAICQDCGQKMLRNEDVASSLASYRPEPTPPVGHPV